MSGLLKAMIAVATIAFCAGAFLMWFIPVLWGWVKPIIHAWTA